MQTGLTEEAQGAYLGFTEWALHHRFISWSDFEERLAILERLARWPSDANTPGADPRPAFGDESERPRPLRESELWKPEAASVGGPSGGPRKPQTTSPAPPAPLQFIPPELRERWCFTINDPDAYPSVPHGHLGEKTQPWPKLNPYTGCAYARKDKEAGHHRLRREEMVRLWNSPTFRQHARDTIEWFQTAYRHHRFPVANPLKLPRRRKR